MLAAEVGKERKSKGHRAQDRSRPAALSPEFPQTLLEKQPLRRLEGCPPGKPAALGCRRCGCTSRQSLREVAQETLGSGLGRGRGGHVRTGRHRLSDRVATDTVACHSRRCLPGSWAHSPQSSHCGLPKTVSGTGRGCSGVSSPESLPSLFLSLPPRLLTQLTGLAFTGVLFSRKALSGLSAGLRRLGLRSCPFYSQAVLLWASYMPSLILPFCPVKWGK